jgi:apolipoprotein N-acyltransferase
MRLPGRDWTLIAAAAGLLTVAYPPFNLVAPAFVCLVPATLLILRGAGDRRAWRRHLHQGFWYGTVTHAVLLYWLAGALWRVGGLTVLLFPGVAVMFGGATAVVFAVIGRAVARSPGRLLLAFPAGIVFLEWLGTQVGPIALPWHQLALTVAGLPVLLQTADIAGAGGTAFILALINASLALAWWQRQTRRVALAHLEVAATVLVLMVLYGVARMHSLPLTPEAMVAVIQPNVATGDKWTPGGKDAVVERTLRLAQRASFDTHPDFMAFPETALPGPLYQHRDWTARLTQLSRRSQSTILTGGIDTEWSGRGTPTHYNAAFAVDPLRPSETPAVHRKQKLIPMVEWIPSTRLNVSQTRLGGFSPGRHARVSDSPIGAFGTLLCYELTFADMARRLRQAGAEVLVTLSNDAWSGHTAAPYQHFAHASLRAVENRVSVIRAANTGVSGIVDPLGRVVTRTHPFVETYASGRIQRSSIIPLAVQLGEFVGPLCLGLLLALMLPASFLGQLFRHRPPGRWS